MRFLVLSDLHQKKSGIEWINRVIKDEKPDFVLFLGDVTDSGTGEDAAELIGAINSKVYVIPGNTDSRDFPRCISDVAIDMHGKSTNIGGYELAGLGGSNITIFGTSFELTEDEIYKGLKPISKNKMILMTHVPSYGILDSIPSGLHVGSPSVKKIVDEFHPILALSGHVHEDRGVRDIAGTVFVNPGPAREGYSAIVSINEGKPSVLLLGPLD